MRSSSKNVNETNLLEYAEQAGISVYFGKIPLCESMSLCRDGKCYIAIDPFSVKSTADGIAKLGHEIGHCMTGSFYNRYSPCDVRGRYEYRADKWAAHELIDPDELQEAVDGGCTKVWELAEHFNVPEDFIKRAVYIYQCEGLLPP